MPNLFPAAVTLTLAMLVLVQCSLTVFTQGVANEDYQNQQRAVRLLQFDKEITAHPDRQVRNRLRYSILDFIYSKQVRDQYPATETLIASYFDEIAADEKAFNAGGRYERNNLGLLLHKNDAETAKRIEAKYKFKTETAYLDYDRMAWNSPEPREIVEQTLSSLSGSTFPVSFPDLYVKIRLSDPAAAAPLLLASLALGERSPTPQNAATLNGMIFPAINPPPPIIAPDLTLRFYKILVPAARVDLSKRPENEYSSQIRWTLRRALPDIQKVDPKLAAEARAVVTKYRGFLDPEEIQKDEADDRIEWAEDKLAQAIVEAEASRVRTTKSYLWSRASLLAVQNNSFRQAVELIMKADPDLGSTSRPLARDEDMWNRIAGRAAEKKDWDAAEYAIAQITDKDHRASAMFRLGSEIARREPSKERAVPHLANALAIMEAETPRIVSACWITTGVRELHWIKKGSPEDLNELTARAIRIVNRISLEGPPRSGVCLENLFRPSFYRFAGDPELAKQIKEPYWRLSAQIEAEKHRKYPIQ